MRALARALAPLLAVGCLACGGHAPEPPALTITFADLSLSGSDTDALLDALFGEEGADVSGFQYPPAVRALEGRTVELTGYMIALETSGDGGVRSFMLVRDLASCCFGGMPRPDEWVHVHMAGGDAELYPYVPVVARGELALSLQHGDAGLLSSAFQIRARDVRARE